MYAGLWWGNLREKVHLEDPVVNGGKWDMGAWTGLIWLRIGAGGGHL